MQHTFEGGRDLKSYEAMEEEALAVRRDIIEMLYQAGSGHPGGSLSVTDILFAFTT